MSAAPLSQDESSSLRRSALMLHGVGASDQAWLLGRIAEPQRTQVSALLQELRTLGIPPDGGVVRQAVSQPARTASTPHERVSQACATRLADVLKDEPCVLVARLIQAGPWSWTDAFLALLAPARRAQVQELLDERAVPPRLAGALVDAVATRLGAGEDAQPRKPAALAWQRWLDRLAFRGAGGGSR